MMPFAQIAHSTTDRLRLKIVGRRGSASYFANVTQKLASAFTGCSVEANALTGSILFIGDGVDIQSVTDFGEQQALFRVQASTPEPRSISLSIISPLQSVNRNVKAATSGRLDLPGALFISLLLFGIIEIIRGNWKSPPWYTAFWYAFGLYSKTLFDHAAALADPGEGDD